MQDNLVKTFGTQTWAILPSALESISSLITGPNGDVDPSALVADRSRDWISYAQKEGDTTIINISGPIFYNIFYFGTNLQVATRNLQAALADKSVKRIVLHINSPGGAITGVGEFARMIYQARGEKEIVGYAQGMCASAAYWIYSACGIRVADPTALLGSIGVIFRFTDYSEAQESRGIKEYTITSKQSPMKNISPADPKGQKAYQGLATELAAEFIDSVALYTGVNAQTVESDFGNGFVLTGEKAVKAGMADEVGSMRDILTNKPTIKLSKGEAMTDKTRQPDAADETKTSTKNGQAQGPAPTVPKGETTTEKPDETPQGPAPTVPKGETTTEKPDETPQGNSDSIDKEIACIKAQNEKIVGMLSTITGENETLKKENEKLKAENGELADKPDEGDTPKANGLENGSADRGW